MVKSLIRHSKIKPQDIIWSMPPPQVAKTLLFSLKNPNGSSSHFRMELSKICSLLLTFPCLKAKNTLNFTEKLHQHHACVQTPKSTCKYHAVSGQKMRNNCAKTSPNTTYENYNKWVCCDC